MESQGRGITSANPTTHRNPFNSYVRSGMMYSPVLFFYIVVSLFIVMLVMAIVMGSCQQGGGAVAMGALCFLVFIVILCIIAFGFIQEQKSQ
jgi:hypothetical protein